MMTAAAQQLTDLQRKIINFLPAGGATVKAVQKHLKALGAWHHEYAINEALRGLGNQVESEMVAGERRWRKARPATTSTPTSFEQMMDGLKRRAAGGGGS